MEIGEKNIEILKNEIFDSRTIRRKSWDEIKENKDLILKIIRFNNNIEFNDDDFYKAIEVLKKIEQNTVDIRYLDDNQINNLKVPQQSTCAWQIFKKNSLKSYGFETIRDTEESALKILNRLRINTINKEPGKGLVMGYVQSGKTLNIEALITMAADNGFNVFVMLTGTIENLRQQNLDRLKNDIEYNGKSSVSWTFVDDIKNAEKHHKISGILNSEGRIVVTLLKQKNNLTKLNKWLTESVAIMEQQKMKVLVIDDESDQASINTKKDTNRTSINQLIVDLVNYNKFGCLNYISYTATPYANFLNENSLESLYPKDFIVCLPKSKQYIGASEIFGKYSDIDNSSDGLDIVRDITQEDLQAIKQIEQGEKQEIPATLKSAICWFICTLAIRRYKAEVEGVNKLNKSPVSMMIHTDAKTIVHRNTGKFIKEWINTNRINLLNWCEEVYREETLKFTKKDFFEVMPNYDEDGLHNIEDYPKFEDFKKYVTEILDIKASHIYIGDDDRLKYHKGIHVIEDNSNNRKGVNDNGEMIRIKYPEENEADYATGFIIIGGNTLSRGLTLKGLTSSYFARKTNQVDSLTQMGRWFGYRIGYELLPRIWLTRDSKEKFTEAAYIEEQLRDNLASYDLGTKPSEYAPKIKSSYLTTFKLTATNKMQNAVKYQTIYEKVDNQTVIFDDDIDIQRNNLINTINYIKNKENNLIQEKDGNYVERNVSYSELFDNLLSKIKFYDNAKLFGEIKYFIKYCEEKDKRNWDVIIENSKDKYTLNNKKIKIGNIDIQTVNRSRRLDNRNGTISIGVLSNPKDKTNAYLYETGKDGYIYSLKRPKLFIYIIDKDSKANGSKNRADMNYGTDIVGFKIYVPNKDEQVNILNEKNKRYYISQIMKKEENS